MNAQIYIEGVIGDAGEGQKCVKLIDVVSQIEANKGAEEFHVFINSPGGSVEEGNDIFNYLKSIPNLKTIASKLCASIATKIHLAAKPENRFIEEGTIYMIHNPLFMNVSGNAKELKEYADYLAPIESDLVSTYTKATGLSKAAVSGMMKQETEFTAEKAIEFGFASAIWKKNPFKAVAFSNVINKQINTMAKEQTKLQKLIEAAKAFLSPEEQPKEEKTAVSLMLKDESGNMAMTDFEDLVVGDPVFMEDGSPATDGDYQTEDGSIVVTVEGGVVSKIEKVGEGELEIQVVAMQGEISEMKSKLEALEAENNSLKEENASLKADQTAAEQTLEALNAKLKVSSTHKPQNSPVAFRKPVEKVVTKVTAQSIKEARNQAKKK